jgi:hypothetical protein
LQISKNKRPERGSQRPRSTHTSYAHPCSMHGVRGAAVGRCGGALRWGAAVGHDHDRLLPTPYPGARLFQAHSFPHGTPPDRYSQGGIRRMLRVAVAGQGLGDSPLVSDDEWRAATFLMKEDADAKASWYGIAGGLRDVMRKSVEFATASAHLLSTTRRKSSVNPVTRHLYPGLISHATRWVAELAAQLTAATPQMRVNPQVNP